MFYLHPPPPPKHASTYPVPGIGLEIEGLVRTDSVPILMRLAVLMGEADKYQVVTQVHVELSLGKGLCRR